MPAPSIVSFPVSVEEGETGLVAQGTSYGGLPGKLFLSSTPDLTGTLDDITPPAAGWTNLALSQIDIPASPNNSTGALFLIAQHADLALSQPKNVTLVASGGPPVVEASSWIRNPVSDVVSAAARSGIRANG